MKVKFNFPFDGTRGRREIELRNELVNLLNIAQREFTFGTFTTNASNFHSDGCIYAVRRGDKASCRKSKSVVFRCDYGASLPSTYADGETGFDKAYIAARAFILEHCKI